MAGLLPDVDPDGLLEYSVVYTDRSLNHMSARFQGVMRDISATLKRVYHAHSAVIVPGSGTFGMEAVARQFAKERRCLVIRNGWFSYRWSQILEMGRIPSDADVLKARRLLCDAVLIPCAVEPRCSARRLVGRSPAMQEVFRVIGRLVNTGIFCTRCSPPRGVSGAPVTSRGPPAGRARRRIRARCRAGR